MKIKGNDLEMRSILNLKILAITIYHLILERNMKFDLIISIGNSGLFMSYLTKIIFKILKKPMPIEVRLPIFRYKSSKIRHSLNKKDWYDNSNTSSILDDKISKIKVINNILIVDDEIGLGVSVRSVIDLVQKSISKLNRTDRPVYTIVAEDHGFVFDKQISKNKIKLYSIGKQKPWVYHIITFHIPESTIKVIKSVLKRKNFGARQIANVLVGLSIKAKSPEPHFTDKYTAFVNQNVNDIKTLRYKYNKLVKNYLLDGINTYKQIDNKITNEGDTDKIEVWKLFYN